VSEVQGDDLVGRWEEFESQMVSERIWRCPHGVIYGSCATCASEYTVTWDDSFYCASLPPDTMNGKGSSPRPPQVPHETVDKHWVAVFGEKRKHVCDKFVKIPGREGKYCYFCAEPEVPF
jgi:hypothetical protein